MWDGVAAESRWLVFCGKGCKPVAMERLLNAPGGGVPMRWYTF
jgi:hypothetical protein